jgi:hypothetical protein
MNVSLPPGRPSPTSLAAVFAWLVAYLAVMSLVAAGVYYGRKQALAVYGTGEAQAQWDAWRQGAKRMAEESGPVKRRLPKSAEPPALVLMRDYFAICLSLALVLSTVLFATFMFMLQGALRANTPQSPRP